MVVFVCYVCSHFADCPIPEPLCGVLGENCWQCFVFVLFVAHLRPIGVNVLGYQSYLLQPCHPAVVLGVTKDLPISPPFSPTILYRDTSSTFLLVVNQ